MLIPEEEQENVLNTLWVFLRNIESKVDPKVNILDKNDVEGCYRLLTRIGMIKSKPRWNNAKSNTNTNKAKFTNCRRA